MLGVELRVADALVVLLQRLIVLLLQKEPISGLANLDRRSVALFKLVHLEQGVVLHGFSVGGYLWGECLVKLDQDEAGKATLEKIKGQIWDSAADITEIPVGVPHAVLPKNPTLQGALRSYIT